MGVLFLALPIFTPFYRYPRGVIRGILTNLYNNCANLT